MHKPKRKGLTAFLKVDTLAHIAVCTLQFQVRSSFSAQPAASSL